MIRFLKNAALALTLPGLLASSLPAAAAVGTHGAGANIVLNAGYGDHDDWGRDRDGWRGRDWQDGDGDRWEHHDRDRDRDRGWDRGWDRGRDRDWDRRGYGDYRYDTGYRYGRPYYDNAVYADARVWRGNDGRYYCRRSDGTTGLLIGGAVGAVVGREVAGYRGDRTAGSIIGAAAGALLGRSVDRNSTTCR